MNIADLNPSNDPKFGRSIFNWVKRNCQGNLPDVFMPDYGTISQSIFARMKGTTHIQGSRLSAILRGRAPKLAFRIGEKKDITELFWAEYSEKGLCFIDPEHWRGWEGRFKYMTENARICNWCGYTQHKIWSERIVQRNYWEGIG